MDSITPESILEDFCNTLLGYKLGKVRAYFRCCRCVAGTCNNEIHKKRHYENWQKYPHPDGRMTTYELVRRERQACGQHLAPAASGFTECWDDNRWPAFEWCFICKGDRRRPQTVWENG